MKKILLVLVVAAIGLVSCQKEEEVKPVQQSQKVMGGDIRDMGGWD